LNFLMGSLLMIIPERVFASLNPEEFNRCFLDWIETWKLSLGQYIINIDGKTLRYSYDSVH
jgi:hypothetical protein